MAFARPAPLVQSAFRVTSRKAIGNHAAQPMPPVNRRSFLAGSAALAAVPAFAATAPTSGPVDVVVIGAGSAGIAAARKLAAAGRHYVVIEASDHVGGRCVTETTSFGVPFDRGAHWIYLPDVNPLTKTPRRGLEVYPAPQSQKVRIGRRFAREDELEDFLTAQVHATRAIDDAARKTDIPCEQVMPGDLGDWRGTVELPRTWRRSRRSISPRRRSAARLLSAKRGLARCSPGWRRG
jgi:phytoene dehydrogenase-like protein